MSTDVTRSEFQHLESRVALVEREVEGEKMVTRHILEQTRRNSDDLAALKSRMDRMEGKVDEIDRKLGGLIRDLPGVVGEAVRDALRERDARR